MCTSRARPQALRTSRSSGSPTSIHCRRPRQVSSPDIRLILRAQAAAERQRVVRVQCECEQPDHHALVRFGRMSRNREDMVAVVAAVDVGYRKLGLEYRRFERHERQYATTRICQPA
jgi:hypothetical protein